MLLRCRLLAKPRRKLRPRLRLLLRKKKQSVRLDVLSVGKKLRPRKLLARI